MDLQMKVAARRWTVTILLASAVFFGGLFMLWYARPNESRLHPDINIETWTGVRDGLHNSNTDLIHWNGSFFMVHANSPWHLSSESSRLWIWKSSDARNWTRVKELDPPVDDIRDPKFAVINGKLFLYALLNKLDSPLAEPYKTVYMVSPDGGDTWPGSFSSLPSSLDGWLFWRPKTHDNITWYVPAYWYEHGRSFLFKSTDGINWTGVSLINDGGGNDETAIEFYSNGTMICTARIEDVADSFAGGLHAGTLVSVSNPPYTNWTQRLDTTTRLDGPALFNVNDTIFAIGRFQPDVDPFITALGSIFSRKRTSLFLVEPGSLTYISDLPSGGDTSYAGVALVNDTLFTCYYTSDISRDYPWFLGMFNPTDIMLARIPLEDLGTAALAPLQPGLHPPWDNHAVFFGTIAFGIGFHWYLVKKGYLPLKLKKTRKTTFEAA